MMRDVEVVFEDNALVIVRTLNYLSGADCDDLIPIEQMTF
jgi:hypothetical protein